MHTPVHTCTMRTAERSRYFSTSCCTRLAQAGVTSLGFRTAQLPAAIAPINGFSNSWIGKFQGPMMRQTPLGSRTIMLLPGFSFRGCLTTSGSIHLLRLAMAALVSSMIAATSPRSASAAGRRRSD